MATTTALAHRTTTHQPGRVSATLQRLRSSASSHLRKVHQAASSGLPSSLSEHTEVALTTLVTGGASAADETSVGQTVENLTKVRPTTIGMVISAAVLIFTRGSFRRRFIKWGGPGFIYAWAAKQGAKLPNAIADASSK